MGALCARTDCYQEGLWLLPGWASPAYSIIESSFKPPTAMLNTTVKYSSVTNDIKLCWQIYRKKKRARWWECDEKEVVRIMTQRMIGEDPLSQEHAATDWHITQECFLQSKYHPGTIAKHKHMACVQTKKYYTHASKLTTYDRYIVFSTIITLWLYDFMTYFMFYIWGALDKF